MSVHIIFDLTNTKLTSKEHCNYLLICLCYVDAVVVVGDVTVWMIWM